MAAAKSNVEVFREWATSIGCPQDAICSEEALKSVFNSRQRDVFESLMQRIRPRQEVATKRLKLLAKEVDKLNGQVVQASRRAFLPQQLQTYLKIKDLEKKRAEILLRIAEQKEEYDAVSSSFKSKNIQILNAEHRNNLLHSKADILSLKSESLAKDLKKEENTKSRLLLNMPVKLNSENVNDQLINEAVQKALAELEHFDNWATENNCNPSVLKLAKDQLWAKLRNILSKVPNFLLFKAIMRLKEQQLENLRELSKTKIGDSFTHSTSMNKEPMSEFEKNLMKLKIDALALFVHHKKAVESREKIEVVFCERFSMFVNEIREKVAAANANESDEHIDEVVSEYMMQRNWHANLKAANECIQKQFEQSHNDKIQYSRKLDIQEVLLGSVKQAYVDTNGVINNIQHEMEHFRTIKMKIIYSSNLLKHKHKESSLVQSSFVNIAGNMQTMSKLNAFTAHSYMGAGDIFECSGMIAEGKFSSTLLDVESSERSFASTTLTAGNEMRSNVPPNALEIKSFASMPLQNFSYINKDCSFIIGLNPLVTESQNLSSILQLTPGTLLAPRAALKEVRQNIAFADSIAAQSSNLQFDFEMETANISSYNQRVTCQHEVMNELIDKFDLNGIRIKRSIKNCFNILDFIIQNPLRHYIPSSVVFNNKTYPEYEAEHNTYMRMINVCDTLK